MRPSAWLGSMASRVFLILLVGIVAAAAVAFTVADLQRREGERRAREQRTVDRVADVAGFLSRAPRDLWPTLLGKGPEALRWPSPGSISGTPDPELTQRLAARLGAGARVSAIRPPSELCRPARPVPPREPPRPEAPPRKPPSPEAEAPGPESPPAPPPPPACRLISLNLAGAGRIAFVLPIHAKPPGRSPSPLTPVFLAVVAAAAALLAYAVARVATAPLRRLSAAAADLGRDLDRPPLTMEGPSEVRQAAAAFNAMQVRLKRHLAERTHMLAAITHDLQTPLTRQRLRLEKVADAELRAQLLEDQAAMLEMIRAGLDLARVSGAAEAPQELDVDSLLHSLCEDAVETGAEVAVTGRCRCSVSTRPQALRRCVANLLDNALKYAGAAELSAAVEDNGVVLRVVDGGPGIPPAELDRIFEPFVRLESSRSRETGGVGLGLTIAQLLAERAGAKLTLRNRAEGGLEAVLLLARAGGGAPA